jgi:hypothetical protein
MLQQVNLYEPILRDDQKVFSATAICVGLCAVAAVLVAISAFSEWRTRSLDRQLLALHAQEATQKKLIAQANAIVDLAESHDTIESHLKAMAIDLSRRQQALRYLNGGALTGAGDGVAAHRGFVGRMTALARQQIDGLWLTVRIRLRRFAADRRRGERRSGSHLLGTARRRTGHRWHQAPVD